MRRSGWALVALLLALNAPLRAEELPASGGNFGGAGLIEMRNARLREDGTLEVGTAWRRQRDFWFLNIQALPFLETTFRLTNRLNATTGRGTTVDRAFDAKLRLLRESQWVPALAVGLQDAVGTGIYGGEYLVASKRLGPVDLTLGFGWGRLGTGADLPNIGLLANRSRNVGQGGTPSFGTYFRGRDIAVFGGAEWSLPPLFGLDGLRAKLEYSGDALRDERGGWPARHTALRGRAATRWNAGLQWQDEHFDIGAHFVHGTDALLRLSLRLDAHRPPSLPAGVLPLLPPRPAAPTATALGDAAITARAGLASEHLTEPAASAPAAPTAHAVADPAAECRGGPTANAAAGLGAAAATVPADRAVQRTTIGSAPPALAGPAAACPAIPPPNPTATATATATAAALAALRRAGFRPLAFVLQGPGAHVLVTGGRFRRLSQVAGRVMRALHPVLPPQIETLRVEWQHQGVTTARLVVLRQAFETPQASAEEVLASAHLLPAGDPPWPLRAKQPAPGFAQGPDRGLDWEIDWGIAPRLPVQLGDPRTGARWQLAVAAGGRVSLGEGFAIAGSVSQAVAGNLGGGLPSNSLLPHVRSDLGRYARAGTTSLPALYAERIWTPADDIFTRVTAGLLEPMFAGISTEALWRPASRGFALGVDLNWVQQRDYAQKLGLRRYRVTTGHLSAYAELPWFGLFGVLRGGRYLAGDWGTTIELGRRFDNGIEVGGFASFTTAGFRRFGEGSFDKGIYLRIPLEIFGPETTATAGTTLRPVVRDGGQRLAVDNPLWELTRDGRAEALGRGYLGFLR